METCKYQSTRRSLGCWRREIVSIFNGEESWSSLSQIDLWKRSFHWIFGSTSNRLQWWKSVEIKFWKTSNGRVKCLKECIKHLMKINFFWIDIMRNFHLIQVYESPFFHFLLIVNSIPSFNLETADCNKIIRLLSEIYSNSNGCWIRADTSLKIVEAFMG